MVEKTLWARTPRGEGIVNVEQKNSPGVAANR